MNEPARRHWKTQLAVAVLAASCGVQPIAFAQELCKASEVIAALKRSPLYEDVSLPKSEGAACRSSQYLYRSEGTVRRISVARISTGIGIQGDVAWETFQYFLRTPEGQVINLGDFPPIRVNDSVYERIGYALAWGGGLVGTDSSIFCDRIIERHLDRYCMIYRMKGVFIGEFRDCDGRNLEGTASYKPGVITQREAATRLCNRISAETSQPCEWSSISIIGNALLRAPDGSYQYHLVARRRVREYPELKETTGGISNVPVEYDERTYRMDARTGGLSLVHEEAKLCGATCKPLPR